MRRLSHPIRAIREPFGTAGLIVAMIALVAALGGTALAAAKLNSTQKKEVEKIAKKFAGKPGSAGSTGPAGGAGPAGLAGGTGKAGNNGKEGKEGKEGSPWTAGGTLPSGRTLKGEWNADAVTVAPFTALHTAVSYALPLSAAPNLIYAGEASVATGTGNLEEGSSVVKTPVAVSGEFTSGSTISGAGVPAGTRINAVEEITAGPEAGSIILKLSEEATATATGVALTTGLLAGCTGSAENPAAAKGDLCVYAAAQEHLIGPSPSLSAVQPQIGFTINGTTQAPAGQFANFHGTWAVTAP